MKRSNSKLRTSKKRAKKSGVRLFSLRRRLDQVLLGVLLVAVLALTNHAGPLNSVFRPLSTTAPKVQKDNTKLYTAEGLASSSSILVKFKSSASSAAIASIHKQTGASVKRSLSHSGVQQVNLPSNADVGATLKNYRSRGEVEYAEPNFIVQRFIVPNDTLYAKQWNLAKIGAPQAWDVSQGGYGPIAVVDTGIKASHGDLTGEVLAGYNFLNDSTDTNDDHGHGTHVAGIIAGTSNNGNGIASIGFKGSLLPVKVLDNTGSGTYGDLASGIMYAADRGAKIINLSLGGSSSSQTLQFAVDYARQRGAIIVAAAGNNGNSAAVYPAAYAGVVAVSAATTDDNLAAFSSYGSNITVSAPGVGIISTYNNGGYATMSGTSMATPEVAGLLGLALSRAPMPTDTLLANLRQSSDKVGPYPYNASGWNQYFGYGRINAAKLLQLAGNTVPAPTAPVAPSPTGTSNGRTAHGQADTQFSVTFEGTVDSVDQARGVITVKVQSVSQNLKMAHNNLIDLYVTGSTTITSGNQNLSPADLSAGDKIGGKALWQNNRLSATTLKVQGGSGAAQPSANSSSGGGQGQGNGQGHRR